MEAKIKAEDVYSLVTNRIIDLLENGQIPWRKPWRNAGIPKNLISKRQYSGINLLLLNSMDFKQNVFLTWNQLKIVGGSIKKGEKGCLVVFQCKVQSVKEKEEIEEKFILRYYKVFNISQCENLPEKFNSLITEISNDPIVECQKVIEFMPLCPKIVHSNDCEAYYSVLEDYIKIPSINIFETSSSYYGTLFHELIHATGSKNRLARESLLNSKKFGSEDYSKEELTAEIGSCYLKSLTGVPIEDLENSTSYIENWLKVLKGDRKFIVQTSSKAQQAVNFILNKSSENN